MRALAKDLKFTEGEIAYLEKVSHSKTDEVWRVNRANMLLLAYRGVRINVIAKQYHQKTTYVTDLIKKTLAYGAEISLNDLPRSSAPYKIGFEERAWIVYIACEKPKAFNLPNELWSYSLLTKYIRGNAQSAGYPVLSSLSQSRLWEILDELDIKLHKLNYHLERKDPEFEKKMLDVFFVYKEVEVTNGNIGRKKVGYEYKRLGIVSLLAGLDLHTGEVYALVRDTHKSSDFIEFLKHLDSKINPGKKIRLSLDNHSAHTSEETMKFLLTNESRFEFSFTPTHGSWLNIIETFFGKMAYSFLCGIRVTSKEELVERIFCFINIFNKYPVVHKWTYLMDTVDLPVK